MKFLPPLTIHNGMVSFDDNPEKYNEANYVDEKVKKSIKYHKGKHLIGKTCRFHIKKLPCWKLLS